VLGEMGLVLNMLVQVGGEQRGQMVLTLPAQLAVQREQELPVELVLGVCQEDLNRAAGPLLAHQETGTIAPVLRVVQVRVEQHMAPTVRELTVAVEAMGLTPGQQKTEERRARVAVEPEVHQMQAAQVETAKLS
jgi:hypothetical protein